MLLTEHITADKLFAKLRHIKVGGSACVYSRRKCEEFVPLINEIIDLKTEQHAVILAHSYVTPEIQFGVADFVGDSYQLSKDAMTTNAERIVFAAVRFMGETAQILNPEKEVLIPAEDDGCTLADAINARQVRGLRREYPEHTFVCYINTTAEVKAECDVCVTSANAYNIVQRLPHRKIYFLPDRLMGQNLANEMKRRGADKEIAFWNGTCYVHEEYELADVEKIRMEYPGVKVVTHPECKPAVVDASDFVGSTNQMLDYMRRSPDRQFLMLTECGLSARLNVEYPDKQFVGTCTFCRYMKSNSLESILRVLKHPADRDRVILDEETRKRAHRCIGMMFRYAR